jgi:type IV pilus assembly protein PilO
MLQRSKGRERDPRVVVKGALGALGVLNLIAAGLYLFPPGGSAASLDAELAQTRAATIRTQQALTRLKASVEQVRKAREAQEKFTAAYFMDRRTASSTILNEIGDLARKSGLKPREHAFAIDPIEGSDDFSMMTVTANYEGSYGDLVQFVNAIDRSPRFLIIESITAQPQQSGGLQARFKMNCFLRETAGNRVPQVLAQQQAPAEEAQ